MGRKPGRYKNWINTDWSKIRRKALEFTPYGGLVEEKARLNKSRQQKPVNGALAAGKNNYGKRLEDLRKKGLDPASIHMFLDLYCLGRVPELRTSKKLFLEEDQPWLLSLRSHLPSLKKHPAFKVPWYSPNDNRISDPTILCKSYDEIDRLVNVSLEMARRLTKPGPKGMPTTRFLMIVFLYLMFEGNLSSGQAIDEISNLLQLNSDYREEFDRDKLTNDIYREAQRFLKETGGGN